MFPIVTIVTLLQFCAPTVATTTSSTTYEEDLSVYRPTISTDEPSSEEIISEPKEEYVPTAEYVTPTNDIGAALDTVLYRIKKSRADIQYVDGFSIQLYSGNNRDKANQVKVKTYEVLENQRPRVSYDQPNYKVRVGEYYSRLEANADFVTLQKHFSRAVLVPVKIKIED
ncbi:SPOR domain-containing protein [Reichenbachiella carrageenanivorans]|uniref:SPOR domain-containing protein n=1 Tax=Reichenbachiella carrageenanivorans TaxID=2979869 RepID=A0ABY6D564_9BACT|nr:SPOR domain-containing protein [Reichenbachiella carrageenanivorans]UXX80760.1 SPOR domain-containing protein [Reichenbachiella carrageenanivorans]